VVSLPADPRAEDRDAQRHLLLMMIIWEIEMPGKSVAEIWAPPMTADGRQLKLALDLEAVLRDIWNRYIPPKPPPFRMPGPIDDPVEHRRLENARADVMLESRSRYRHALEQLLDSDGVFRVFPEAAHPDLRRARALLADITGEGFATYTAP